MVNNVPTICYRNLTMPNNINDIDNEKRKFKKKLIQYINNQIKEATYSVCFSTKIESVFHNWCNNEYKIKIFQEVVSGLRKNGFQVYLVGNWQPILTEMIELTDGTDTDLQELKVQNIDMFSQNDITYKMWNEWKTYISTSKPKESKAKDIDMYIKWRNPKAPKGFSFTTLMTAYQAYDTTKEQHKLNIEHIKHNFKHKCLEKTTTKKPEQKTYDIKTAIIEYINQSIIQAASNGETEIEFKMNVSSFRLEKNDTFLGWYNICYNLLLSQDFPKQEVIYMLVNHGFDIRVFQLWNEKPELTAALLNNTISYKMIKNYEQQHLKIKINWINPNPSKNILLSPLVAAKKSLKMADKYHKTIHDEVISILHKKSKSADDKEKRFFKCIGNEYFKINDSQKNLERLLYYAIKYYDRYDKKLYELIYKNGFRLTKIGDNMDIVVFW